MRTSISPKGGAWLPRAWARAGTAIVSVMALLVLGGCLSDDNTYWDDLAFSDQLDEHDPFRWERSDGWSNGTGFACGWEADNVVFDDGTMTLVLDDTPTADRDFSCGEYRTLDHYRYGRYEVSLKAAKGEGVVTAFFVYTGPPFGDPWDEITIEILGRDTTEVQFTYFADGVQNATKVDLDFDAAEGFHTYAFEWTPEGVRWFVDGKLEHVDTAEQKQLPSKPGRIFTHIWANEGLSAWAGEFTYPGAPITAAYDWIRYTPLSQAAESAEVADAGATN